MEEDKTHVSVLSKKRKVSICPVCGNEFVAAKGKKYCSKQCRDNAEGRDGRPSKEMLNEKYNELHSWEKVARYFGLTKKIVQNIRKK